MDFNYEVKVAALRSYLPFLAEMMNRLEKSNVSSKEMQLQRMRGLGSVLKNDSKLKPDALDKCEDVLRKMTAKVRNDLSYKKFLPENDYLAPDEGGESPLHIVEQHLSRKPDPARLSLTSKPAPLPSSGARPVVSKGDVDYRIFHKQPSGSPSTHHSAAATQLSEPVRIDSHKPSVVVSSKTKDPRIILSRVTTASGTQLITAPVETVASASCGKVSQPVKPQLERVPSDARTLVAKGESSASSRKPTAHKGKERIMSGDRKSRQLAEIDMFTPKSKKSDKFDNTRPHSQERKEKSRSDHEARRRGDSDKDHDRKNKHYEPRDRSDRSSDRHERSRHSSQEKHKEKNELYKSRFKEQSKSAKDRFGRDVVRIVPGAMTETIVVGDSDSSLTSPTHAMFSPTRSALDSKVVPDLVRSLTEAERSPLSPSLSKTSAQEVRTPLLSPPVPIVPHFPVQTFRYCADDSSNSWPAVNTVTSPPSRLTGVQQDSSVDTPYWKSLTDGYRNKAIPQKEDIDQEQETRIVKLLDKPTTVRREGTNGELPLERTLFDPTVGDSGRSSPYEERQVFFRGAGPEEANEHSSSSMRRGVGLQLHALPHCHISTPAFVQPFPSLRPFRPLRPTAEPLMNIPVAPPPPLIRQEDITVPSKFNVRDPRNIRVIPQEPVHQPSNPFIGGNAFPSSPYFPTSNLPSFGPRVPFDARNRARAPFEQSRFAQPLQFDRAPASRPNRPPRPANPNTPQTYAEWRRIKDGREQQKAELEVRAREIELQLEKQREEISKLSRDAEARFEALRTGASQPSESRLSTKPNGAEKEEIECPVSQEKHGSGAMTDLERKQRDETEEEPRGQVDQLGQERDPSKSTRDFCHFPPSSDLRLPPTPTILKTADNRQPTNIEDNSPTTRAASPKLSFESSLNVIENAQDSTNVGASKLEESSDDSNREMKTTGGDVRSDKVKQYPNRRRKISRWPLESSSDEDITILDDMNCKAIQVKTELPRGSTARNLDPPISAEAEVENRKSKCGLIASTSRNLVKVQEVEANVFDPSNKEAVGPSVSSEIAKKEEPKKEVKSLPMEKVNNQIALVDSSNIFSVNDHSSPRRSDGLGSHGSLPSPESYTSDIKSRHTDPPALDSASHPEDKFKKPSMPEFLGTLEDEISQKDKACAEPLTVDKEYVVAVRTVDEELDTMIANPKSTIDEVEDFIKRLIVTSGALKLFEVMPKLETLKRNIVSGEQLVKPLPGAPDAQDRSDGTGTQTDIASVNEPSILAPSRDCKLQPTVRISRELPSSAKYDFSCPKETFEEIALDRSRVASTEGHLVSEEPSRPAVEEHYAASEASTAPPIKLKNAQYNVAEKHIQDVVPIKKPTKSKKPQPKPAQAKSGEAGQVFPPRKTPTKKAVKPTSAIQPSPLIAELTESPDEYSFREEDEDPRKDSPKAKKKQKKGKWSRGIVSPKNKLVKVKASAQTVTKISPKKKSARGKSKSMLEQLEEDIVDFNKQFSDLDRQGRRFRTMKSATLNEDELLQNRSRVRKKPAPKLNTTSSLESELEDKDKKQASTSGKKLARGRMASPEPEETLPEPDETSRVITPKPVFSQDPVRSVTKETTKVDTPIAITENLKVHKKKILIKKKNKLLVQKLKAKRERIIEQLRKDRARAKELEDSKRLELEAAAALAASKVQVHDVSSATQEEPASQAHSEHEYDRASMSSPSSLATTEDGFHHPFHDEKKDRKKGKKNTPFFQPTRLSLRGKKSMYDEDAMEIATSDEPEIPSLPDQYFQCKMCDYLGKKIIFHYATTHTNEDIPYITLSEDQAKMIQKETSHSPKEYSERRNLEYTMSWIPDGTKSTQCHYCTFKSSRRNEMIQHVYAHRSPRGAVFYCIACNYSCQDLCNLYDHVTFHTGEYRYECGYCTNYSISHLHLLKTHMATLHGAQDQLFYRVHDPAVVDDWLSGFICVSCRFFQISEKNMHRHLGSNPRCVLYRKISLMRVSISGVSMHKTESRPVDSPLLSNLELLSRTPTPIKLPDAVKNLLVTEQIKAVDTARELVSGKQQRSVETVKESKSEKEQDRPTESTLPPSLEAADGPQSRSSTEDDDSPPVLEPAETSERESACNKEAPLTPKRGRPAKALAEGATSSRRPSLSDAVEPPPQAKKPRGSTTSMFQIEIENAERDHEPEVESLSPVYQPNGYASSDEEEPFQSELPEDIESNPILSQLAERIGIQRKQPRVKAEAVDHNLPSARPKLDCQKNGQYTCNVSLDFLGDLCEFRTRSRLVFLFHIVKNHGSLICAETDCWFTCDDNNKMDEHYDDQHPYGCKQMCGFCFQLSEDLYIHSLEVHSKEITHVKCKINDTTGLVEAIDEPPPVIVKQEAMAAATGAEQRKAATLRVRTDILAPRVGSAASALSGTGSETSESELRQDGSLSSHIDASNATLSSLTQTPMITNVVSLMDGGVLFQPYTDAAMNTQNLTTGLTVNDAPVRTRSIKNPARYKEMCQLNPIVKFFKCMEENCSVTVNDQDIFIRHLSQHTKGTQHLMCCYCLAMALSPGQLASHMINIHGSCNIQCLHCFYRASSSKHAAVHSVVVHGVEHGKTTALECGRSPYPSGYTPKKLPSASCNLRPYPCVVAGAQSVTPLCHKIQDPIAWISHLVTSKHITAKGSTLTCPFCKVTVSHVGELCLHFESHNFSFFQCASCRYLSNSLTRIINHLALFHPASPDLCYTRIFISKDRTLIDLTTPDRFYEFSPLSLHYLAENWDNYFLSTFKSWSSLNALIEELALKSQLVLFHNNLPAAALCATGSKAVPLYPQVDQRAVSLARKRGRPSKQPESLPPEISKLKLKLYTCKATVTKLAYRSEPPRLQEFPGLRLDRVWRKLLPPDPPVQVIDLDAQEATVEESKQPESDLKPVLERYPDDGKMGKQLFLCGNPLCKNGSENEEEWRDHMLVCDFVRDTLTIQCGHCQKKFKQMPSLEEHIHIHGSKRFVCGLCGSRYPIEVQLVKHIRLDHKVDRFKKVPANPSENNPDSAEFVFLSQDEKVPEAKPSFNFRRQEQVFQVADFDKVPKRWVFLKTAKCGQCEFRTNIRTNLLHHLYLHSRDRKVHSSYPVNPVPCLESQERHFDKMINMASSSNESEKKSDLTEEELQKMPKFVPENKRFVCTSAGCRYLTLDETMLKFHLKSLHGDQAYSCEHCDVSDQPLEKFITHLKFHGPRLYKCPQCVHFHWQRTPMGRHIQEKHGNKGIRDPIVIREFDDDYEGEDTYVLEVVQVDEVEPPKNLPWRCSLCRYTSNMEVEVKSHVRSTHNIKWQFQCGVCSTKVVSIGMTDMEKHFATKHPDGTTNGKQPLLVLASFYYKYGPEAVAGRAMEAKVAVEDAKPLWRRGMPRSRHIRGIMLDEEVDIPEVEGDDDDIECVLEERHEVHGSYGMPTDNCYTCPKCPKYKTSQTREFREHLLRELGCKRFVCDHCNYTATTRKLCLNHSTSKHPGVPEAISQIPLDKDIDSYINGVISHQAQLMNRKTRKRPAPTDTESRTPVKEAKIIDISSIASTSTKTGSASKAKEVNVVSGAIIPAVENFSCDECEGKFQSRFSYLMHMKLNHLELGKLSCGDCTQTFNHEQSVAPHYQSVHKGLEKQFSENPKYQDLTLSEIATLAEAYKLKSSICEKCGKKYRDRTAFENHLKEHERPECLPCQKAFADDAELESHLANDHSVCTVCNRVFNNRSSFALHVIQAHPEVSNVESVRGEILPGTSSDNLRQCLYCSERVEDVDSHFKEKHKDIADFVDTEDGGPETSESLTCVCQHCGYRAESLDKLVQHFSTNHQGEENPQVIPLSDKSGIFVCEYCGFNSRTIASQKGHYQQEHTNGSQPFSVTWIEDSPDELDIRVLPMLKCDFCPGLFSTEAGILSHFRIRHQYVDPSYSRTLSFSCPVVGCGFTSAAGSYPERRLVSHLKMHFKPFTCNYCPFNAVTRASVRLHLKSHPDERDDSFTYNMEDDCAYRGLCEKIKLAAEGANNSSVQTQERSKTPEIVNVADDEAASADDMSNLDIVIDLVSRGIIVGEEEDIVELSD